MHVRVSLGYNQAGRAGEQGTTFQVYLGPAVVSDWGSKVEFNKTAAG
jgi:hypothetical protein